MNKQRKWRPALLVEDFTVVQNHLNNGCSAADDHQLIAQHCPDLLRYPIDMSLFLFSPSDRLDEDGVLYNQPAGEVSAVYHPIAIAQFALAHWNAYLADGGEEHRDAFLAQAAWLLSHEVCFSNGTGGWLVPFPSDVDQAPRLILSALAQGGGISVLIRAYQLTCEDKFLQFAQLAVHSFELDILDGGVSSPVGEDGIFFEETAIYPAKHAFSGYILALLGLYDYVAITGERAIEAIIARTLTTFHCMIGEFDGGYWTHTDLLRQPFACRSHHSLHIHLLAALAQYSNCEHCAALAARWRRCHYRIRNRLWYLVMSRAIVCYDCMFKPALHHFIYKTISKQMSSAPEHICVPIPAFPVAGGMRSVLADVAQVMQNYWHMTYVTHYKGEEANGLDIEIFGLRRGMSPWQFPNVWFYSFAGGYKLFKLLCRSQDFSLILPQDGIFSAAFAALVGKIMGVRVVCMDHGNVTWLVDSALRREWATTIETYPWYRRIFARVRLACYCLSLRLLARIATPWIDHFLVAGDEVDKVYREQLRVHPCRITRYAYIVDVDRFEPCNKDIRAKMRVELAVPENAIVITLINRLAPEKGLSFALEGIALALSELSPETCKRAKVLIAGDGPLRTQVKADILRHGLESTCVLWGEANPSDVVKILATSDIFLYTGTRGTNYSMAVLEAMAAGCAVVASISPLSNAWLLADGRGISILPGDARVIASALTHLCNNLAMCHQMGRRAREYVATHHSASMLERTLRRM